ncbi:MAG: hypothetical protein HFH80_06195 [Lachnospiraceae bacterium]|nr:hypothetical protein [Lachnospiraceae bacterium]
MKNTVVTEWLKSNSPEAYDMINDTCRPARKGGFVNYCVLSNEYDKFFIYKAGNPEWDLIGGKKGMFEQTGFQVSDPDLHSRLLQAIYEELYPRGLTEQRYMRQISRTKSTIVSDTMTSPMTSFTHGLMQIVDSETAFDRGISRAGKRVIPEIKNVYMQCAGRHPKQKWWTVNFCTLAVAQLSACKLSTRDLKADFYTYIDENYPHMKEFLAMSHTIGNYCPVPAGFNTARCGPFARRDYWDLTLQKIYQWYTFKGKDIMERDDLVQNELLHQKGLPLYCLRWLEWFEKEENKTDQTQDGWHNFVDTLYLQDYVYTEKVDGHDLYEPRPFWEGHTWDNPEITPKTEKGDGDKTASVQETDRRLGEITQRIRKRSERIIQALEGRTEYIPSP